MINIASKKAIVQKSTSEESGGTKSEEKNIEERRNYLWIKILQTRQTEDKVAYKKQLKN